MFAFDKLVQELATATGETGPRLEVMAFAAAQVLAIAAGDKSAVAFFADQICRSAQKLLLN